jgi:hypothetical protein
MKFDDNISSVIYFIEEEFNLEEYLDVIFSRNLSDDEFEKQIFEYVDMIILEISNTLHIEFDEGKALYDEYLTRNIIDIL